MDLADLLKECDMTIAELARCSGLPYSTVSEAVNGRKSIGRCCAETVYRIASALNTTVENMLAAESSYSFPDKYSLSNEESIFLAKRFWDENVYSGMRMENRNVTFPETRTILDGINVPGVTLDDIIAIRNMRDAWKYVFSSLDERLDLAYICRLNSFIARDEALSWGCLRTGSVGISGTDYKPAVPAQAETEAAIRKIVSAYLPVTERALDLFSYITYHQLFWEGNKRTAMTAANRLLVRGGGGILTVRDSDMGEFNVHLRNMYDIGDSMPLKHFLYDKAIKGIDFLA